MLNAHGLGFVLVQAHRLLNCMRHAWHHMPECHDGNGRIYEDIEVPMRRSEFNRVVGHACAVDRFVVVSVIPSSRWSARREIGRLAADVMECWRLRHHVGRGLRPLSKLSRQHDMR